MSQDDAPLERSQHEPPSSYFSPWALAAVTTVGFAIVFEPVRLAVIPYLNNEVGGVGGVGGLANLAGPENADTVAHSHCHHTEEYCYKRGVGGSPFTALIIVALVGWVGPWIASSLWITIFRPAIPNPHTRNERNSSEDPKTSGLAPLFRYIWAMVNLLWFLVPLGRFWFSIQSVEGKPVPKYILAISLSACYALSWNLMYVAMPTAGIFGLLLPLKRHDLFLAHRCLAYWTTFWGLCHGGGEIIYLATSFAGPAESTGHRRSKLVKDLEIWEDGENILYLLGIICFLLMMAQGFAGYVRKRLAPDSFRLWHRRLAGTLLVMAAAHWWPFALFLIPVMAFHGANLALLNHVSRLGNSANNDSSPRQAQQSSLQSCCDVQQNSVSSIDTCFLALTLTVSLVSSLMGFMVVWTVRQFYMITPGANLYIPFLFPPASVMVSFIAAYASVRVLLWKSNYWVGTALLEGEDNNSMSRFEDSNQTTALLSSGERQSADV